MANSNQWLRAEQQFPLRKLPLMLGLALAAIGAQAQTAAAPTLKETVVSASRNEQDKDDLAVTVEVINRAEMEEKQMRDLRDVARDIPNVSVKRQPLRFTLAGTPAGREGDAGFNIRGLEGNRVLMLTDGVRTPRSYVFSANNFGRDYFDLGLVERIEIVKGPASALYGSDGVAGLVNFISVEPVNLISKGSSIGGRASLGYSGDDKSTVAGVAVAGKASDTVQWLLAGNVRKAEGLSNMGSNGAFDSNRTTPNPQNDRSESFMAKLVVQPHAGSKHVVTVEHVNKRTDAILYSSIVPVPSRTSTSTIGQTAFSTAQRDRVALDSTLRTDWAVADALKFVFSTQIAKSREFTFEDRNTAADRERDVTYDENTLQVGLQADKVIRMGGDWAQKLTYGVDYVVARVSNFQTGVTPAQGETFPLKRFPDTVETTNALYLQDEFIGGKWSITPGVRFDSFDISASQSGFFPPSTVPAASLSGTATSPKLGVLFRATPQWSVYGQYAAGFKAPNAFQVNNFFKSATANYDTLPNPNLKPESSQNYELGLRGRLGAVSLDAAVFDSYYTDFIEDNMDVTKPGDTRILFQSTNINKARITGFEIKLDWAMGKLGDGDLSSSFAYGESRGRDESTGLATSGKPLNSVDPAKLTAGLKYRTHVWDLRLDVAHHAAKDPSDIYVPSTPGSSQYATPAATTLDIGGQWRISKGLRLNAAINNLTDEKYWRWTDVRGVASNAVAVDAYTQSGRYAQVSLAVDF